MKLRIKKQVGGGYQVVDLESRLDLGSLGMMDIPIEVFKSREEAEKYINKNERKSQEDSLDGWFTTSGGDAT